MKVLGLNGAPELGLEFHVIDNKEEAREEAEKRKVD